jgi:threonine/homoserine efflux transporter RhtA
MFTLLGIGGTTWAAIAVGALILILIIVGVIRKIYPEKKRKPLKKI